MPPPAPVWTGKARPSSVRRFANIIEPVLEIVTKDASAARDNDGQLASQSTGQRPEHHSENAQTIN